MRTAKDRVISGALFLAVSGMIAKLLGAVYRIPLTNVLGAEGIGLYQLIFPVYSLAIVLTSAAIPNAVARLVSEHLALKKIGEAKKIFSSSCLLMLISGIIGGGIIIILSKSIAMWQGAASLTRGYIIVAPSLIFVALASAFKGWFQGNMNFVPTAVSQLLEQLAKMLFGLLFAFIFAKKSLTYAVDGALIGLTISELICLLVMVLFFIFSPKNKIKKTNGSFVLYTNKIIKASAGITASNIIMPVVMIVDSFLIVKLLARSLAIEEATSLYGILTGAVNSLINMPAVVAIALAVTVVPIVCQKRILLDEVAIKDKSTVALKLGYLISVPAFFGIYMLAGDIVGILYRGFSLEHAQIATTLLKVSSITVIFTGQLQIYSSLLQALGKGKAPIASLGVGAVLKVVSTIALIENFSITAVSIANIICFGFAFFVNAFYYKYLLGKNIKLFKNVSKILLSGVIMALAILPILVFAGNIYARFFGAFAVACVVYFLSVILLRVLDEKEILTLPFGRSLTKIMKKFNLLKGDTND